jgi:hypothetical protein
MANWTTMTDIFLWSNKFTGTIPDYIRSWTKLKRGWFEKNLFVGSMPAGVCNLTGLIELYADCNITNCPCCKQSYNCSTPQGNQVTKL